MKPHPNYNRPCRIVEKLLANQWKYQLNIAAVDLFLSFFLSYTHTHSRSLSLSLSQCNEQFFEACVHIVFYCEASGLVHYEG